MGLGDWLMASADVRKANEKWGVRCVLGDGKRGFWCEDVFLNNPRVCRVEDLKPDEQFAWVPNYPTHRPYLLGADGDRFYYNPDYKAEPGELFLSDQEKREGDYILIEPHTKKSMCGPNKRWPWDRWRMVVKKLDLPWAQMHPERAAVLKGVRHIKTQRFRDTLGWLANARLLVTTDGALHHAAAALGVPAVVIWGGVASPKNLGYDTHINLHHGAEPCGTHSRECPHCKAALDQVSVEEVVSAIERALERR